jgi:GNAT superfamily N-acetyltransferase
MGFVDYERMVNTSFKEELMEFKLTEQDGYLEISSIAVQPKHRGKGLGSAIIEDVIWYAREEGYSGVQLMVAASDRAKLTEYYNQFGFLSAGDIKPDLMRIVFIEESV